MENDIEVESLGKDIMTFQAKLQRLRNKFGVPFVLMNGREIVYLEDFLEIFPDFKDKDKGVENA